MKKIFFLMLIIYSANSFAQVINESETNFPAEGTISESSWGTYLLSNDGALRALRIGVSNDSYTRAEIEFENNNTASGKILFKTTNSNGGAIQRMIIDNEGKVGIGTSALNSKFNVVGQDIEFYSGTAENTFRFGRNVNENFKFFVTDNSGFLDYNQDDDGNSTHIFYIRNLAGGTSLNNDIRFQTTGETRMTIKANGNVGIGTSTPNAKFEVGVTHAVNQDGEMRIGSYYHDNFYGLGLNYRLSSTGGPSNHLVTFSGGNRYTVMSFIGDKVGIGTSTTGTHRLAVEGTIGAREIKVEAPPGWSDFVFDCDYELKDLEEVETFIKENNHLPDIPSEKEVLENGIQVGEMNAKLLQKIEELTLYMIEMNKEVKTLKKENSKLRSIVENL